MADSARSAPPSGRPQEHGGKGFSAHGHSQVVQKISTRSSAAAVTVMVPNSLGPGELLMRYGTDTQRKYYLPKLASGEMVRRTRARAAVFRARCCGCARLRPA